MSMGSSQHDATWGHASRRVALAFGLGLVLLGGVTRVAPAADAVATDLEQASDLLDSWTGRPEPLQKARALLDDVLARDPQSAEAHRLYARLHVISGYVRNETFEPESLKRAEASLDRAVALSPGLAEAHVLRGHVYRLLKRPDAAEASLLHAESLGSDSPWLALNRADLRIDRQEYDAALALCLSVTERKALRPSVLDSAESCLRDAYAGLGRVDDLEAVYRRGIERRPDDAWPRGNYASFLLCTRQDARSAIEQATAALARMDYGVGRHVLAAARYRDWADKVHAGRLADAERAWAAAVAYAPGDAAQIMAGACSMKATRPVLEALRTTHRATLIEPMLAVLLAADNEAQGVTGVFGVQVQATGGSRGEVFLNSEPDYRDQRNLTVRFTPDAVAAFHARHGQGPDTMFKGQRITVIGVARRQRIDFYSDGLPTGKYYYQTHVVVTDPAQVALYEAPPPRPSPPLQGLDV